MPQSESERTLLGRLGAYTSWANTTDRGARTAPARAALEARFLAEADGDPQRAESLRRAYFVRLALKSAQSRRRARQDIAQARAAEADLRSLNGGAA